MVGEYSNSSSRAGTCVLCSWEEMGAGLCLGTTPGSRCERLPVLVSALAMQSRAGMRHAEAVEDPTASVSGTVDGTSNRSAGDPRPLPILGRF